MRTVVLIVVLVPLIVAGSRATGAGDNDTATAVLRDWGSNVYVSANGKEVLGPPSDLDRPQPLGFATSVPHANGSGGSVPLALIPPTTKTGPYRRVFTRPGYTYLIGKVTLPCMAAHLPGDSDRDKQVGFVYTGGWGATANGAFVDAGFQKNSYQTGRPKDHYSLFIAFASVVKHHGVLKYKTKPHDPELKPYPCGQDVMVEFYSDPDRVLHLNASGTDAQKNPLKQTILQETAPEDGWDPAGGNATDGAELKRMVSIAYSKTGPIAGSWYFGHGSTSAAPQIRWHDVQVGKFGAKPHPWTMSDTWGCQNVPNDALFTVTFSGYADESVAIDMQPDNSVNVLNQKRPLRRGVPPGCG